MSPIPPFLPVELRKGVGSLDPLLKTFAIQVRGGSSRRLTQEDRERTQPVNTFDILHFREPFEKRLSGGQLHHCQAEFYIETPAGELIQQLEVRQLFGIGIR